MGHPPIEIRDLIRKAKHGDSASLGSLIDLSKKNLFRFCFYLTGNSESARDLLQDTYVRVLEKIHRIDENSSNFMGWMFKVAKNLFLDQLKARHEVALSPEALESLHSEPLGPDLTLSLHVRQTLSRLPPEDRFTLLLIDLEGASYTEAAAILEISESALKTRLYRIRQLFLKLFGSSDR